MKWAMIYYWWNDTPDVEVWRDMANPIIPSIATFRANNATMPIFVLDASNKSNNWGRYPFKLNFDLVCIQPGLRFDRRYGITMNQGKLLSRMGDVHDFARNHAGADVVLFADTDLFWVKDFFPVPPVGDGLYGNKANNGLFYYGKNNDAYEAFRLIREYTEKALVDHDYRRQVVDNYYGRFFNDEAVYIDVRQRHPELFRDVANSDNNAEARPSPYMLEHAKNFHLTQTNFGPRRGLFGLAIEEFYDKLRVVLNDAEIVQIFGEKNIHLAGNFPVAQLHKARMTLTSKVRIYA